MTYPLLKDYTARKTIADMLRIYRQQEETYFRIAMTTQDPTRRMALLTEGHAVRLMLAGARDILIMAFGGDTP